MKVQLQREICFSKLSHNTVTIDNNSTQMKNIQNIKYVVKKKSLAFGFYFTLYFMSVCIYGGDICMYMLMDECGDQGSASGIVLQELANYFREIGFLTGLDFTNYISWLASRLCFPSARMVYVHHHQHAQLFMWELIIKLRSLCLHCMHLTH